MADIFHLPGSPEWEAMNRIVAELADAALTKARTIPGHDPNDKDRTGAAVVALHLAVYHVARCYNIENSAHSICALALWRAEEHDA